MLPKYGILKSFQMDLVYVCGFFGTKLPILDRIDHVKYVILRVKMWLRVTTKQIKFAHKRRKNTNMTRRSVQR